MNLIIIGVTVFAIFVNTVRTQIAIEKDNNKSSIELKLVKAAGEILKSCYGSRITPVGLAGNATGMISRTISVQKNVPVVLIDATGNVAENHPQPRYKLQVFVVTASSPTSLRTTLRHIKTSLWWNHMAAFLILDWSPRNHGCSNAFEMLWAAWEMDLLNAKLICHHRTRNRLIYNFNPYTSQAPQPWQIDKTYSGRKNHPWTLFVRGYEEDDEKVCKELDFEKTHDLGGYEIRVSVTPTFYGYERTKASEICVNPVADIFCKIIFPTLNATAKVLSSVKYLGNVDKNGKVDGILGQVANGSVDFAAIPRLLITVPNQTIASPHWQTELLVLTEYSGYKSQLSKIRSVIDSSSRIGLCLVLLTTIFFFKYFMTQDLSVALLNTLRISCNSSLPKIPRNVAPRVYLGSLFLFAVTMLGIYQGKLASLLTHDEPLRNVNTMMDLAELGHTIYGHNSYAKVFDTPEFEGRYVGIEKLVCTKYVMGNPRAACVGTDMNVMQGALQCQLHLSHDSVASIFAALPIRPDWPLETRFNILIMRSIDAYLLEYSRNDVTDKNHRLLKLQEAKLDDHSPKVLTLKQLSFAFAILGIGLGCATVSFIIEVSVGRIPP